jgi:hypothetical protein
MSLFPLPEAPTYTYMYLTYAVYVSKVVTRVGGAPHNNASK